jgi:lipopolysaccharide/colanic/teichoic acid biosynthesis glycosyltransferase
MQFFTFVSVYHCITPTIPYLESLLKRSFDVLFALTLLFLVLSWLVPVLWILNLFVGGGALFFSHQREGKDRKLFWCYKFRTFPKNAVHPMPGEPTTTPIPWLGTLLRNSGIDELPQVLNILKGEMSVVGPRPHLPEYNAYYQRVVGQKEMDKRHNALPGLTGLAQIRGYRGDTPNNASIHNRINSDIEYINRQSFLLDLEIITISLWMLIRAALRRIFN